MGAVKHVGPAVLAADVCMLVALIVTAAPPGGSKPPANTAKPAEAGSPPRPAQSVTWDVCV
jgi:hypothetical protein